MFYRNIRNIRKGKGITQVQLAEAIGVKRPVISKYESGAVPLTVEQLQKIATALDVPLDYIIGDADVKSSLSWTETSKVLLATPYRVSSLNSGETVSGSAKTQICDYLNCSFRYLLGGNEELEYVPRKNEKPPCNMPTEIIDILDSVAHSDDYKKIQVQISKVVVHNLKAKDIDKEHLHELCKFPKDKLNFLFGDSKSKGQPLNLSDLIRIWREFGLTLEYQLTGRSEP